MTRVFLFFFIVVLVCSGCSQQEPCDMVPMKTYLYDSATQTWIDDPRGYVHYKCVPGRH